MKRLAEQFVIREAAFDPWRYQGEALRLEQEHRLPMVAFPQSHARLVPASERLHAAVVEKRLQHPGYRELDRHVAHAVARPTGRGGGSTRPSATRTTTRWSASPWPSSAPSCPPVTKFIGWA